MTPSFPGYRSQFSLASGRPKVARHLSLFSVSQFGFAEEKRSIADAKKATTFPIASGFLGFIAPMLIDNAPALAIGREYGILEGQIVSLIHPTMMIFLFASSLYAGFLGFQWRRARELAGVIKELKSQRPPEEKDSEGNLVSSTLPIDEEIKRLESERKDLIGKKLNEKHNDWGSLLLGLGVLMSVSGGLNTYLRAGKLFPGPHLFAGAAITVLWALAAALVPSMKKGNETARSLHIAFNSLNILLFAWQIPTGLEIVGKVLQFTTLP